MEADLARLVDKIDSLHALMVERVNNLDSKVEMNSRATAQTVTSITDVVHALAKNVEKTYVRRDNYNLAHQNIGDRLRETEKDVKATSDRQTWVMRALVTTILSPFIVGLIFLMMTGGLK